MKTIETNIFFNKIIDFENNFGTASIKALGFNVENYNFNTKEKTLYQNNLHDFILTNNLSKDITRVSNDDLHFILSNFDYKELLKGTKEISPSILFFYSLEDDFYKGNPLSSEFLYKMYPPLFFENEEKENIFYNKENETAFFELAKKTISNWDLDALVAFVYAIRSKCPKRLREKVAYKKAIKMIPRMGLMPLVCGTENIEEILPITIEVDIVQDFCHYIKQHLEPSSINCRSRFISFEDGINTVSPKKLREIIEKYLSFLVSPSKFLDIKFENNIIDVNSSNHQNYLDLVEYIFKKLEYLTH